MVGVLRVLQFRDIFESVFSTAKLLGFASHGCFLLWKISAFVERCVAKRREFCIFLVLRRVTHNGCEGGG